MRICIYTDVHFSEYSSIIRSLGKEYSTRLEYLIQTVTWAEKQAIMSNCDEIFCLGDFFDKPDLNSRELTALKDIQWANLPHTFVVGNHEASVKSLKYNSVTALKNNGFKIVNSPEAIHYRPNITFLVIPYLLDEDKKSIEQYMEDFKLNKENIIVLSHNDVKGIRYGAFESKNGFDVNDIENNCRLFLNGHLHNGTQFCKNGINLGNLSGQNFSENAFEYKHGVFILDTNEHSLEFIENPYAFNFYKIELNTINDLSKLDSLKNNLVLSLKCKENLKEPLLEKLKSLKDKLVEKRIMYVRDENYVSEFSAEDLTMDHLAKFVEFSKENIENSEILDFELAEVCK